MTVTGQSDELAKVMTVTGQIDELAKVMTMTGQSDDRDWPKCFFFLNELEQSLKRNEMIVHLDYYKNIQFYK